MTKKKWKIEPIVDANFVPPHIVAELRLRVSSILRTRGFTKDVCDRIINAVADAVAHPIYGNGITVEQTGRGRPADIGAQMLSSEISGIFRTENIRGNSLRSEEDNIGVIAEVEAVAQTARKLSNGETLAAGVMARPARISGAEASVGPVSRTPHPLKSTLRPNPLSSKTFPLPDSDS